MTDILPVQARDDQTLSVQELRCPELLGQELLGQELLAHFEARYSSGVTVHGELRLPMNQFSITVLFGPSGCGKTTILRCLAGLHRPTRGIIRFGSETWFDADAKVCRSPQERDIGFLFQDYALFPHLTVAQNIGYGLLRLPPKPRQQRVDEMVRALNLDGLNARYPHQISGGQQQRVALARVLVRRPRLLLLDEPLSAIDNSLRAQLRTELHRVLTDFGIPVVLVTHDPIEAKELAHRVIELHDGRVTQKGTLDAAGHAR
jgi:molybdate transport system ATP-binding protein